MGWRGVVRSINAANRASERNAKRKYRELELQQKHFVKMEASQQAGYEVAVYENRIDLITSIHLDCGESIDWLSTKQAEKPRQPVKDKKGTRLAQYELDSYRASLLDKLLFRKEKQIKKLKNNLELAIKDDERTDRTAQSDWEKECLDHQENSKLAAGILTHAADARLAALKKFTPFGEISGIGSEIILNAENGLPVQATLRVHSKDIIPTEIKSLLQSGKLSTKKMPKLRFYELHQDYVCSCAIRVAREIFCILPDEIVIVTATDSILDEATRHLQEVSILFVAFSRQTLLALNIDNIDPSDSMQNFLHNMAFKRASGFSAVKKIKLADNMRLV